MRRLIHAFAFAERAHRGQLRKYTGEPYIIHPMEVAGSVAALHPHEDVVIAALFHDIVEDTPVTLSVIDKAFGSRVAQLVSEVTDVSRKEDGNRETRKALDRAHLIRASYWGQTIKLADLISNTSSIVQHDPDFAVPYMREKKALLDVMTSGDPALRKIALAAVTAWEQTQ